MLSRGKILANLAIASKNNNSNANQSEYNARNYQDMNNAVAETCSLVPGVYSIVDDGMLILSEQERILLPFHQELIGEEIEQQNIQNSIGLQLDTEEVSETNIFVEVDSLISNFCESANSNINLKTADLQENIVTINQEIEELRNAPDYLPEEDSVRPNEEDDIATDQEDSDYVPNPEESESIDERKIRKTDTTRTRKRKGDRKEWQRYKRQILRKEGKSYVSRLKISGEKDIEKVVKERQIGPRCKSQYCLKSKKRLCNDIPEGLRQELFTHFWSNLSWEERKIYISSLVNCEVPKQKRRAESGDRRGSSFHYFLKINNEKKEVCRDMFCNTFALGAWSVKNWSKNVLHGMKNSPKTKHPANKEKPTGKKQESAKEQETGYEEKTDTSCTVNKNPAKQENATGSNNRSRLSKSKEFAENFIKMLPKMEAHYCRKDTKKLYLETTFQSLMHLYRVYKSKCEEENIKMLSRFTFTEILNELNVSLFQPKKDQCDTCCKYRVGSLSEKAYIDHKKAKDRAREEKSKDKTEAISKLCKVFSADVEAVKLAPFLMASAIYFKTKLCCHNYTVYDLESREVDCYWWNEAEGDLKAEIFASLLGNHLQLVIDKWPEEYPRVIKMWSDGCMYQNKNKTLSNALLELAIKNNFIIHQKYLQVGHTQMEVDSVHAAIERKLKNREIHLPSDYIAATKEARSQERENNEESANRKQKILYPPYRAHYITYDFFKDYTTLLGQRYSSIRPGNKTNDPTVNDVCHFVYLPSGIIQYRLSFDDELKPLPRRAKQVPSGITYPQLFESRLKIKATKWEHLQQLKSVLPQAVHYFYDNLPQ